MLMIISKQKILLLIVDAQKKKEEKDEISPSVQGITSRLHKFYVKSQSQKCFKRGNRHPVQLKTLTRFSLFHNTIVNQTGNRKTS